MPVAFGDTIIGSYIVGVQAADDHFFIFSHRQQRPGLIWSGAAGDKK
jgi:hypothetical protein